MIKFLHVLDKLLVMCTSRCLMRWAPRLFPSTEDVERQVSLPDLPPDLDRNYELNDFSETEDDYVEVITLSFRRYEEWLRGHSALQQDLHQTVCKAISQDPFRKW